MTLETAINWLKVCQSNLEDSIGNGEMYFKIALLNGIELDRAITVVLDNINNK